MTNTTKLNHPKTGIKKSTTIELLEKTINIFNKILDKFNEEIFEPYVNNEEEKLQQNLKKISKNCSIVDVVKLMLTGLKTLIPMIKQFPLVEDVQSTTEMDEEYSEVYLSAMRQIIAEDDAKKNAAASVA